MKKIIVLVVMIAMAFLVAAPAVAQVGQDFDQDADSGEVDQSSTVTGGRSAANQCAAILAAAQTGSAQDSTGSIRSGSNTGESEQEDVGSNLIVSPELAEECEQTINQAAAASSPKQAPKAAPKSAPAPAAKSETSEAKAAATQPKAEPRAEEKKTESRTEAKKTEVKELPKTGGGGATLFALGAGALLVAVGLLAVRFIR